MAAPGATVTGSVRRLTRLEIALVVLEIALGFGGLYGGAGSSPVRTVT